MSFITKMFSSGGKSAASFAPATSKGGAPTTFRAGESDDPLWEEILGNFNQTHEARYGIPMNRDWGADADAQRTYGELSDEYARRKAEQTPAPAPAPAPAPPAPEPVAELPKAIQEVKPVVAEAPPPKVEVPAVVTPDPLEAAQKEYERRLGEMKVQRMKDVSSMKSRMAAGGVASESPGWMQGLETIYSSYEDKLKQLGADPYFSKIMKSTSPWI